MSKRKTYKRSSRRPPRLILSIIIMVFIVAGLMAFFGGPEAAGVFSQQNSDQGQVTGTSDETAKNNENNQSPSDSLENPKDAQQGSPDSTGSENEQQGAVENKDAVENVPSDYRIDVDVSEQIVRVYYQDTEIKQFTASTGVNDSTPLGDFEIQNRGEWFFSEKYQQGAKYWVSFKDWGVYLFHSLPMDEQKTIISEEAAKLGTPASHGCVRLEVENAKWIYDHIPQGTKVHIH